MADNETTADVIAWLRKPREGENAYLTAWRDEIADRLEAAHRRGLGDAAKLREALSDACYAMFNFLKAQNGGYEEMANALDKAKTALSAPPRNCDRFKTAAEAAHKRERGDCAKLREALNRLVIASEGFLKTHSAKYYVDTTEALDKAKAALAAPPRNCDRFASAEEAWDAYDAWVDSYRAQGKTEPFNEFGWLFAPATEKEGGNYGND